MAKRLDTCSVEGCGLKVTRHKTAGICDNCYSFMYYWQHNGKTPRDIIKHARSLTVRQNRIDAMMPVNVTNISRRKKAGRG